ncbi:MAG: inositol monophosphatase [Gammaproteobacteria bacterium]|nr:MAG: inositol monophosphatase [Gammaproteobacteria bacterium]
MHPLVNIAVSAVRQASRISLHGMDIVRSHSKGPSDFTNKMELKAEQVMIDVIKAAYPNHAIAAKFTGSMPGKDITWLIDSLDGLSNFHSEIPHFAITIAIKENDRIQHSVIYAPVVDELYTASRGRGSSVNGRRLRVTNQKDLKNCTLATGFPSPNSTNGKTKMAAFTDFINQCDDLHLTGCPSLDLASVAAGRIDGFWQFGLTQWEISAASLMVLEAGGILDDMQGQAKHLTSGNVIAASPKIFKAIAKTIRPHL